MSQKWQTISTLARGPLFGVWAMWSLKRSPAALQLAGGDELSSFVILKFAQSRTWS